MPSLQSNSVKTKGNIEQKSVPFEDAIHFLAQIYNCRHCNEKYYIGGTHPLFITLNAYPLEEIKEREKDD